MIHGAWARRAALVMAMCAGTVAANAAEPKAPTAAPASQEPRVFTLSSVFANGRPIPPDHACGGANTSPVLTWIDPPAKTKSFAVIADDPDAPSKTWVHWVVFNIPPTNRQLSAAIPAEPQLPDGTRQGTNDFGATGYGGPCPPSGMHRYLFKLYALDTMLSLELGATKHQLEQAMQQHIIAQTQLVGTYQKGQQ